LKEKGEVEGSPKRALKWKRGNISTTKKIAR